MKCKLNIIIKYLSDVSYYDDNADFRMAYDKGELTISFLDSCDEYESKACNVEFSIVAGRAIDKMISQWKSLLKEATKDPEWKDSLKCMIALARQLKLDLK